MSYLKSTNHLTTEPLFEQVCIIGLGLIGASLAQAIKDNSLSKRLVAVDKHQPSISAALDQGLLDAGGSSLAQVVSGSDLIVIAIPVQAVSAAFTEIKAAMQSGILAYDCVISDVCSTKANVIAAANDVFATSRKGLPTGLIPAHPIAGAENSGYHARRSDLFINHSVIICPLASTDESAITKLRQLWESVGASQKIQESSYSVCDCVRRKYYDASHSRCRPRSQVRQVLHSRRRQRRMGSRQAARK